MATTTTPAPEAGSSSHRDWIPSIPRPLQRLFDSVPLITYPPNGLPCGSPGPSELPSLHVFISREGAAAGSPSYNPSCLKWQTFLRIQQLPHTLTPSNNHASPTGALPYLQPPLPATAAERLDATALLPIPSSRFELYAQRHGPTATSKLPFSSSSSDSPPTTTTNLHHLTPDQIHHRQSAYQSLLDVPIRNAWLYALYLSPPNAPLLHTLYIAPVSRSSIIQNAVRNQLRAAARAEIAKTPDNLVVETQQGWKMDGNVGALLTWALATPRALDPEKIYAEAKRAFAALETTLERGGGEWFFGAQQPGLFDAHVFSYTCLILADDELLCPSRHRRHSKYADGETKSSSSSRLLWKDDTLRSILEETCPGLVAHAQRMLNTYWPAVEEEDD